MGPVMRSHVRWARHYLLAQVVWSVRPCSFVCVTEGEEEIKKKKKKKKSYSKYHHHRRGGGSRARVQLPCTQVERENYTNIYTVADATHKSRWAAHKRARVMCYIPAKSRWHRPSLIWPE